MAHRIGPQMAASMVRRCVCQRHTICPSGVIGRKFQLLYRHALLRMPLRHGITKRSLRQRCAGFTFSISNSPEDSQNPCRRQLDALNLAITGYRRCRRYGIESVVIADTVSFDNGVQIGAAIESSEMGNALKLRDYLPPCSDLFAE